MNLFDKKDIRNLLVIIYALSGFFALTAIISLLSAMGELNQFPLSNTNETLLQRFQSPVRWTVNLFFVFVVIPTFALYIISFFYKKHTKLFSLLKLLGIVLLICFLVILRIELHLYFLRRGEYIVAGTEKYLMVSDKTALATYLGLKSILLQLIMCFVLMWIVADLPIWWECLKKRKNSIDNESVERIS